MAFLLIAGSPTSHSRSAALLEGVARQLQAQGGTVARLAVRDVNAQALLHADFSHPDIAATAAQLAQAEAVVIATPVYKAAYSGVLKAWLDMLPQAALQGKTVLPLATGGSPHHMLVLDYALRPVLQSLGARHILAGVYATDAQVQLPAEAAAPVQLAEALQQRLDDALRTLWSELRTSRRRQPSDSVAQPALP
ncbi:MAG: NADPH-dependent FMN reductase [Acidovorax sp.]|jgi:FMN reductase|nr:NADPH-dependent FMN reductase [Acidovorax sp.]MDR3003847.1 NADPH-dependent FMN reductase [Acidovorax sp.]